MPGIPRQQVVLGEAVIDLTCDVQCVAQPCRCGAQIALLQGDSGEITEHRAENQRVACITAEAYALGGLGGDRLQVAFEEGVHSWRLDELDRRDIVIRISGYRG